MDELLVFAVCVTLIRLYVSVVNLPRRIRANRPKFAHRGP